MPSGYYSIYANDELYHFGVKGMKWGVRRYQNSDGTLTADGKKRASERTQEKIDRLNRRIAKTDSNPLMRYTINDNRRGKIEYLKTKKKLQQGREEAADNIRNLKSKYKDSRAAYKTSKTKSEKQKNKRRYKSLRKQIRQEKRKRSTALGEMYTNKKYNTLASRMFNGSNKRFSANGDDVLNAFLKSAGIGIATSIAVSQLKRHGPSIAVNVGSKVVSEILRKQYDDPIYIVPDDYS